MLTTMLLMQHWLKNGVEEKGLWVNVGKTKVMKCGVGLQKLIDSKRYPCGVWQGY